MLRLFAGRENIDKERFIYENIAGETLVIVPDQYTLVAEEQALKYMETECLFDVEILSMNRLGLRLLTEKGTESVRMLDQYGRFMLLSKVIKEHKDDFDIFSKSAGKLTFTNMLSDFISEFKQQNCTLEEVDALLEKDDADPLLRAKLKELGGVIDAYETAIRGKYTDSEDYISMYVDAIGSSEFVKDKTVWVYGYDSITPKFTTALLELAKCSRGVNFIVNRSDFDLDEAVVRMLERLGDENGVEVTCEEISPTYECKKSETIRRIESGLWRDVRSASEIAENNAFLPEDLTVVSAANPYFEAETAAVYVWHLIRDLGFKMRDIQIIANDATTLHPIIKRVFDEYGLPVFMDSSRDITDTAPVAFIINLLRFVVHRQSSQFLFAMLKTGLAGAPDSVIEDLENYVRDYRIIGTMWDKPFKYGADSVGVDQFDSLNRFREMIMAKVQGLKDIIRRSEGNEKPLVEEFVRDFRDYLETTWDLSAKVEKTAIMVENAGFNEEAQRIAQSYEKALEILDQIVEIMGDSVLDIREFTDIYETGLANVEVGVIPPSVDGLSLGTMIRTRPRPVRAAVVIGANEGTLPLSPSPEGLFSLDEKEYFKLHKFALGKLDDLKVNEENAALYRMLSKPTEKLYISWSACDAEGNDIVQSPLIDSLLNLFPRIQGDHLIKKDVISAGWGSSNLGSEETTLGDTIIRPDESMRHLMARIKDKNAPAEADALTEALIYWYRNNRKEELDKMLKAAKSDNLTPPLGKDIASKLYGKGNGVLALSASSISNYFDCPFKYYIDRGLRPREERDFMSDSRSIGDVYHECLMAVAKRLIGDRETLAAIATSEDDDIIEKIVAEELDKIASSYRGGVFVSTGNEEFRMTRIREICSMAAKSLANQLSSESVVDASFEEKFSRRGKFSPIHLKIDDQDVYVEGKIDRADVLAVGDEKRVRIIDYKTGSDELNLWKMRHGYKMQLMIYMISASGDYEPAGLFYFNIKDPIEKVDDKSVAVESKIKDMAPEDLYKLKGRYINESGVLEAMPGEVLQKANADGGISREVYEQAKSDVLARIEETAAGILKGSIDISPLNENKLSCNYCSYKPICKRDPEYPKNFARTIPKEPKEPKKKKD